jgi:hypothetical protein
MQAGAPLRRAAYRVRQFGGALLASLHPLTQAESDEARNYLSRRAWPLFEAMSRGDQRHSLNVLHTLRARGVTDSSLLQAGLLHDCAKRGGGVRIWHRVAVVLLQAFRPVALAHWREAKAPRRESWEYPFWAHCNHPQRGADLAVAAGCDAQVVWLIAHHQDYGHRATGSSPDENSLRELQAADDDN